MCAEVGGVDIGSVVGRLGVRKFWSQKEPFLPATVLRRLKTVREFERGDKLLQVACQVSALALEMTVDALRDASTYARR